MKDALGRTISEGDYLIYPGRQGASMWLNLARVICLGPGRLQLDRVDLNAANDKPKRVSFGCLHRAIVVPAHSIPEKYRSQFEGPLVWDDHSVERIRKKP